MSTRKSYILKETCSGKLKIFLSIYDPLVDVSRSRIKLQISFKLKLRLNSNIVPVPAVACLKVTIETLEQGIKSVPS